MDARETVGQVEGKGLEGIEEGIRKGLEGERGGFPGGIIHFDHQIRDTLCILHSVSPIDHTICITAIRKRKESAMTGLNEQQEEHLLRAQHFLLCNKLFVPSHSWRTCTKSISHLYPTISILIDEAVDKAVEESVWEIHSCPPGKVTPKWDNGKWALLCRECNVIVGYMSPSPDVEEVARAAEHQGYARGWADAGRFFYLISPPGKERNKQ